MTPSPFLLVPSSVQEAHDVHMKRWEGVSQGDEACLEDNYSVNGRFGGNTE